MVVEKDKQLKVDNWGSFFLHRLSLLYKKEEKCDGTLLFKDGKSLKVHRLVLMTCTDYFDEQLWTNNTFTLPPVLGHDDVKPIIDFMYTGFLNFNAEIRHGVFTAAKFLNVTILMKLLHAQSDDSPSQVEVKPPPPLEPITTIITNNATSSTSSLSSTSTPSSSTSSLPSTSSSLPSTSSSLPSTSSSAPLASSSAASSSTSSVVRNLMKVKKLPKAAKPLLLTPQPSSSSISVVTAAPTSQSVPGKKLPFWKKRTTVIGGGTVVAGGVVERGPRLPPDYYGGADDGLPPLPSRCELEEVLELAPRDECPTFPSIDSVPVLQPRQQSTQQIVNEFYKLNNKRPTPTCAGMREDDVTESEMDIDDDLDETCTEPLAMEETILLSSARKRPAPSGGGGSGGSAEEKFDKLARLAGTPPKPILKPLAHDTVSIGGGGSSSKKVRFSLVADGKENSGSANSVPAMAASGVAPPTTTTVATPLLKSVPLIGAKTDQLVTSRVSITGDTSAALNPTAIISELMKKNPDLMRKNKNIRVSIVGGGGGQAAAAEKGAATKVRYIVMKQQLGTGGKGGKASTPSNAENTTGPWLCEECGEPGKPEQFETYYLYRRHLHNVHQVRIDARICEYCGYKSSKRNLHLYHLYTKHSVPPPRNIRFPKCDKCNYIALSDSLLIKHNNNHGLNSDKLSCKACVLVFKTQAALTNHQQTCPHRNKDPLTAQTSPSPTKEYNCDYCHKIFNRSINLKAHMRIAHKNESPLRRYDEEEEEAAVVEGGTAAIVDSTASGNLLQVIRLPVVEASGEEGGVLFLASEGGDVATPASESGHQTVILLDGTSELVFESGSGAVMLQPTPQDGSTGASGCTEYIVPEVISAANQLFAHATADQQHETVEGALPEGTSLIVVPSDDQLTDEGQTVLQTETQLTADEGGTPAGQVAADSNCAAADQDTCINIVEEACKRETIIIETSSVIESGGSVIVSAPASAPAAAPAGPRSLDLAKDWDDVEANAGDSRGPTSGSDDQRPSRATFDGIEESILPDMI